MPFRKLLYWPHLICGVTAGIVILLMSATGVLLTYERQMIRWAEPSIEQLQNETDTASSLAPPELLAENAATVLGKPVTSLTFDKDPTRPVIAAAGRREQTYLAPSGESLGAGPTGLKSFFSTVTGLHRWFALEGEARGTARMVTGAANLMFLFIVVSGIYLWVPRVFKWPIIKKVLFFQKTSNARARDFIWHHVMGIWSVIPLIAITATATVFYYSWANDLVYTLAGEEPPVRGARSGSAAKDQEQTPVPLPGAVSLSTLLSQAKNHQSDWNRITLTVPKPEDTEVRFTIDTGTGGEPTKRGTLTFDRSSGAVKAWAPFETNTAGRQARIYIRYLHTGEALGIIGQTIAGLVSLFATILVWTGVALAWRRYITPALKRRRKKQQAKVGA
ncbi:hypothetical protein GCM10017044_18020 [Kordiimonas sediminis]|uniref:PepSY domain-containing protein n=1 Tax=Kordiimonas sediminis TaxID=1735581 RepID=A0A919ASB3_9PROT|nr:PepSY-associated TM helix domain-containing protein [Kordiimonas sediminis]GHF23844.1 hypothetical protein GCM10017044_18020 [Kordiimonas sediminis]